MYSVSDETRKPIFEGVQGENESREIQFDISSWIEELGDGACTATAKRPTDTIPYPVTVTRSGNVVTWKPNSTDTAIEGIGAFQLEYSINGSIAKTRIWNTKIAPSLDPAGDPPDPYDNWLAEMRSIEAGAIQAAEDAETAVSDRVPYPVSPDSKYGTSGQLLRSKGNGNTEWSDVGLPTDAQTAQAVSDWLDAHPEATTTVEDGSITRAKLDATLEAEIDDSVKLADLTDGTTKVKFLTGIIRNTSNGWEFINNSTHKPLNLTTLEVVTVGGQKALRINYGFTAKKILSFAITADETFIGSISAGASVDPSNCTVLFRELSHSYGGLVTVSNNTVSVATYSNFTSGTFSNGIITLNHPSISPTPLTDQYCISALTNKAEYRVITGSNTNSSMQFSLVDNNGQIVTDTTGINMRIFVNRTVNAHYIKAEDVPTGGNFWVFGVMEVE